MRREDFRLFENGVEQEISYFDRSEKPFTVALLLDTSGSTRFRLADIKEAAIGFARQLRPQDRVLVVTFNDEVLLLTEATNDRDVINTVIAYNAQTGDATRLYDAIDLVIRERLNKIPGRKAIVLFTDGVDTASRLATYDSTMKKIEELDALIYPIQYDTYQDMQAQNGGSITVTSSSGWPFPGSRRSTRIIYNSPVYGGVGASRADYEGADRYLHALADKTGGRLYRADDPQQLTRAFSMIAEELGRQYSIGYYPSTPTLYSGERRQIKVRVNRPDLAVRARDSYIYNSSPVTK
jgi:VWFA-related protein